MKVSVKMFAVARELVGAESVELELPDGANVAELRKSLIAKAPALRPLAAHFAIAVDSSYATDDLTIKPGSEIACLPPVSGG